MTTVSRKECHELAALARLSLREDEAERFAAQLGPILGYLGELSAVNTEGVTEYLPTAREGSGLRDDVAAATLPRDAALEGAPAVRDDQIVVPKFKED